MHRNRRRDPVPGQAARLRRVFERILVLSAAGAAGLGAYACSSSSSTTGAGNDDASTSGDVAKGGGPDATGSSSDGSMVVTSDSGGVDGGTDGGSACTEQPDALWSSCCQPGAPFEWDAGADVSPTCVYHVQLPCGLPPWVTMLYPPACNLTLHDCSEICTGAAYPFVKCEVANGYGCDDDAMAYVAADGEAIQIACDKCNGVGRRPAGLAPPRHRRRPRTALGALFASVAHLEAASVHAFERLADELRAHDAPAALVAAAKRSARDEVRHARVTGRLARRFGEEPPSVRVVRRRRARTLDALAVENAVEGCVRETFGALVASFQATHARDAEVRRAMTRIAADETRHAALAWAIDGELAPRLRDRTRERIATARARAVRELQKDAAAALPADVRVAAGLPGPRQMRRMLDELARALWS